MIISKSASAKNRQGISIPAIWAELIKAVIYVGNIVQ